MASDFTMDLDCMYEENLSVFGRGVVFTPSDTGVPCPLRAIVSSGVEPEGTELGTYAQASAKASDFPRCPVNGDLVTIGTSIYNVVDVDTDGSGGLKLLLRFDRETV